MVILVGGAKALRGKKSSDAKKSTFGPKKSSIAGKGTSRHERT